MFQSTLPTRGSDICRLSRGSGRGVSIHAPHEGERLSSVLPFFLAISVSIHAPHEGERRQTLGLMDRWEDVSIHAPHEGERRIQICSECGEEHVSIHAPHEGERPKSPRRDMALWPFQSTLPTRGSDDQIRRRYKAAESFNPRSPRGGATPRRALTANGI